MAKDDNFPFRYDSKSNTVFNMSGNKDVPVVRTKPQSKSWFNTFFDLGARLTAWYALYMIFIACPQNARLDPTAPAVCQRVDTFKHSSLPYVKPYYDTYTEPYLARAQPYIAKGQGYYEQFGAPTVAKGQDLWIKQATPRIKKSYTAAQTQYTKNIHPILDRTVLQKTKAMYYQYIDAHVQQVTAQYEKSVYPHLEKLRTNSYEIYNDRLVPAYRTTAPRVQKAIKTVEDTYATHVEPRVHAVIKWIIRKIKHVVIPRTRILWGVHVQPQLDRIYDKLFRNREAKNVASTVVAQGKTTQTLLDTHASSQVPEPDFDFPDLLEEIQLEMTTPKVNPPAPSSTMVNRPVEVDALLENWRTQIRKAGIESEELYISAISEISETEFDRETSIVENMFVELEDVVESEISSLEEIIMYLANKGRATDKEDPRIKELNNKVAAAGKNIRNRAVEIRNYLKGIKERFQARILERRNIAWTTMEQVAADAQNEIGLKWMWLDGITYNDWQEYHGLNDMANTIKQRIHASGAGSHFARMAELQETAEGDVNAIAKDAAVRLSELKEIGREKILLGDGSENFGTSWVPVGVKMAAEDVKSKVSVAVHGSETPTPTGVMEQIIEAAEKATQVAGNVAGSAANVAGSVAGNAASQVSEAIYGTPQGIVESIVSQASKAVVGEEPPLQSKIVSSAQDVLSSAGKLAGTAVSKASTAVLGTPQGVGESIVSQISTAILGTTQGIGESIVSRVTSVAGDAYDSASSYASEVYADAPSFTDVVDKAKDVAASVTSAAGHGFESASSAAESVASVAGEGFVNAKDHVQRVFKAPEPGVGEKIASKASEVVYGTEPGVVEKATDAAVSVGEKIAAKASEVVYGTEPGVIEKASSVAASVVSDASKIVVGTEPGTLEKATSVVGSVADDVKSKIAQAVDDAGSVVSSVASEATSAYGAATSKVWENK